MSVLTQDRGTPDRTGNQVSDPVAAGVTIYAGAIVMLDAAGNATPGATSLTLIARGIARQRADNSGGGAGDINVESDRNVRRVANDASIDRTHIGGIAYVVDDQTVAATAGGTRSAAGLIVDVDSVGVWIDFNA